MENKIAKTKKAESSSPAKVAVPAVVTAVAKACPQTFVGKVTSTKMKDTCVVVVERYVKHHKYGKFMKRQTKIMAHDAGNTKKEGDQATVEACAPISKRKAFKVIA